MARTSTRKKITTEAEMLWRSLVNDPAQLDTIDRSVVWQSLLWARDNEMIQPLPLPVAADASETSTVLRIVLRHVSNPPSGVTLQERLGIAEWASQLRYPLLEALRAGLLAEAGRLKEAIGVFDALKSTASVFPEIPLMAGRTLLLHAGADSKLLHKAEGYLAHAEHLAMDGSEEIEDEEQWEESEVVASDVVLDEGAQQRLAEIWTLMARLYARLGDPKKAEMYRTRAGSVAEETSEDHDPEGMVPLEGELPDPTVLKPADRKLIRDFIESPQFRGLSPAQQKHATVAVPSFVSLGRLYLGMAPTRLDRYSLEELMLALFPEKVVATLDEMSHLPAVVVAWINFLGKSGQLRDAARLVALVPRLAGDFMANCRNTDLWGMAKTVAMQMVASGVDIENPAEVSRFMASRSSRLMAV